MPLGPLLFIDIYNQPSIGDGKLFMSVEKIYADDGLEVNPSRSTLFLQGLITFFWWLACAFLGVFVVAFAISALALMGVEAVSGQLFSDIKPLAAMVSSLSMIVGAAVFLIILKQLRAICQTLVVGDPFVPQNAQRLRTIWIAVAAAEILRLFSGLLVSSIMGGSSVDSKNVEFTLDLRISVWFLVFAFIIFTEVFREGARLRQEQKLTV